MSDNATSTNPARIDGPLPDPFAEDEETIRKCRILNDMRADGDQGWYNAPQLLDRWQAALDDRKREQAERIKWEGLTHDLLEKNYKLKASLAARDKLLREFLALEEGESEVLDTTNLCRRTAEMLGVK